MPVVNADIASELDKVADLLEIEGANPFRVRAYRQAARLVGSLPRSVAEMVAAGDDLDALPGIGQDLAGKIALIATGKHLPLLDELEREVPPGITALLALPGLGPKRVHALHEALGIDSIDKLAAAAKSGQLHTVAGFGPGIEARLVRALAEGAGQAQRVKLATAEQVAEPLLRHLRGADGVLQVEIAGSYRRRRETVGDLDIVASAEPGKPVMDRFAGYEDVAEVTERGTTRSTIVLRNGLQVDLRVVAPESFGAALLYFTGSKAHNIALRQIAMARNLKLNEYGLFSGAKRLAGATEQDLYERLGLTMVPPELREDQGEIDASRQKRLPHLVTLDDIRGDLHMHTTASDGHDSILAMARAAQALGRAYIAITDHSKHVAVTHGLDAARLARQIDEIDRLNAGLKDFTVLKAIEVDILEDGSLDLPDRILRRLDLVVGAVHSAFDLPRGQQTARLLKAMDNPLLNILAHPTGRLINARPGYAVDIEAVMRGARERGCHLELNAQPDRLDLNDTSCRLAKELGLKVAISTDAHATTQLGHMRFGIDQARRGWLEPGDVLNAASLADLRRMLRRDVPAV
ncbi:DNA polymerase/3'-5' exonuclease PolX [Limobrevibacterium gyesilva]|uniref:DNA-directed DNA polymerase n=1 Tax=Limobrevibacterium gyesilva TaxID=2991712 RepID=A0AA42CH39_9PROT|nr:DNA polymerase/3'-5' exonuclease PolX [Limobrevibacterium gyesilva]MCW3474587.1 DNA polymerase/3'-5' exonuclease PolX [Limobrevibacterium gyesilva]